MPFKNLQKQRKLVLHITVEDLYEYAEAREEIRRRKESGLPQSEWTKDELFSIGRFNNIFREDDKTSVFIFKHAKGLQGLMLWRHIFICRYINRIDRLSEVLPLPATSLKLHFETNLNPNKALTNSCAYQLHSGIGKPLGVKGARNALYELDSVIQPTYEALLQSSSITGATESVNNAFGGYITFFAYQAVLDWAQLTDNEELLSSEPYIGDGAHAAGNALGMSATTIANLQTIYWPQAKRSMRPFDVENLMCEYRKYHKRATEGIQSETSKYRPNFLGIGY